MPHFATQHLIFGLGIATEVDAIDVGTLARVDIEGHGNRLVFFVDLGNTVDAGEGVTLITQSTTDQVGGRRHHLAGENLTRFNQHQTLDLVLTYDQITGQTHIADAVALALGNVDGDIDVFLVRGDGYLGRSHVHVDVATVQIIGAQPFQITRQLLAGILVVTAQEREPARRLQLEQINEIFGLEDGVADNVDVRNRRNRPLVDDNLQGNPVTRFGNDLRLDIGRVATLGYVLTKQLVAHPFQGCALENLAFSQAGGAQALEQVLALDRLVAFQLDRRNGGTLDQVDHQHVAFATQLNILKEAGTEQGARSFDQFRIIDFVTNVQRQGAEYAAGGNPLQTIDADIGDLEGSGVSPRRQ